jgi:transcriptional regulator with XRE-family HTH domain
MPLSSIIWLGDRLVNSCRDICFADIVGNMAEAEYDPKLFIEIDGQELRYLRKKAKLTQQQLVNLVSREHQMTRGYIPVIEKNPQARVSKALAEALAKALEVSLDRLLPRAQSGFSFGDIRTADHYSEGRRDLLREILKEIAEINRRTEEIRRVVDELLKSEEQAR